jgi:toluene monooxygenase system protein E
MPKTYWHLLSARRMPSQYEVMSSKLLYHPKQGVAVRTPVSEFHARHRSRFNVPEWDAFRDPAETTYGSYVSARRDREVFVQQLLQSIDGSDYDARLERRWLSLLDRVMAPLRYPCHGLQMLAAYVAQGAPASCIAIAAAFQGADEIRRISWLAYRTKQLALVHSGFGEQAKHDWQHNPALQPLREVIERMLVSYDWDEAFVALDLVLKPLFDEFFGLHLAGLARMHGDDVLARILLSLSEDQRWHAAVGFALARQIVAAGDGERLEELIERWRPRVSDAIGAAFTLCDSVCGPPDLLGEIERVHTFVLVQCGLSHAHADPGSSDREPGPGARQFGGSA